MKRFTQYLLLFLGLSGLTSCFASDKDETPPPPPPSSDWDEMEWNDSNWK